MIICGLLLIVMANRRFREMLYAMKNSLPPPVNAKSLKYLLAGMGFLVLGGLVFAYIIGELNASLEQGIGEALLWIEGTSIWPSLVLHFIGFALTHVIYQRIRRKAHLISIYFKFYLP